MQFVSRQRIGKLVPTATNTHTTTQLMFESVFSIRSVRRGYKEDNGVNPLSCQFTAEVCTGGCDDRP
jgi:hypothetical protein